MARPSKLASMSVEALLQLRDDIGSVLSRKLVNRRPSSRRLAMAVGYLRPKRPSVDPAGAR